MTPQRKRRTILVGALALVSLSLAAAVTARALRGPQKRFEPQSVGDQVSRGIEALTGTLIALPSDQRQAQLRQALAPDAPPNALENLDAQLEAMKQAAAWKLVAADGYGPVLVKAIYDIADSEGNTQQIALMFERRAGKTAILDVAH